MSLYSILLTKFESDRRPDRSGSWNLCGRSREIALTQTERTASLL